MRPVELEHDNLASRVCVALEKGVEARAEQDVLADVLVVEEVFHEPCPGDDRRSMGAKSRSGEPRSMPPAYFVHLHP